MSFKTWLALAWYDVVGSHNRDHLAIGSHASAVRSWGGVMSYASKYLAKADDTALETVPLGRQWGVHNRGAMPWAKLIKVALWAGEGVSLRRLFRKQIERRTGRRLWATHSLTFFGDVTRWAALWASPRPPPPPPALPPPRQQVARCGLSIRGESANQNLQGVLGVVTAYVWPD